MKKLIIASLFCMTSQMVLAQQETLQTVTDRGNTTTNSLQIGGLYVNANTTKLFINNGTGKKFALSSGANMVTENGFHIYNWTDNPNMPLLSISNDGNLGIGTFSPGAKLDVNGSAIISGQLNTLTLKKNNNYPALAFQGASSATIIEGGDDYLKAYIGGDTRFIILSDGNIGIGTVTPTEKLSVNGKIRAKEIKVETANWPDYVFSDEYKKMSLSDLERFINTYKHLPEMPTATEAEREGIDLGRISKNLVKQQEELVLHLVEKDKEIQRLKAENLEIKEQLRRILKSLKLAQ